MRLATFEVQGQDRIGAVTRRTVIDLNLAHDLYASELSGEKEDVPKAFPETMIDFLRLGEGIRGYASRLEEHVCELSEADPEGTRHRGVVRDVADIHVLPPVPAPSKIVCLGLNYRDHAEEAHVPIPERPILFSKPSTAIVGPGDPVIYPRISSQVDYEVELAVVMGKKCRNIGESDAAAYIGGYTVFNDVSARDIQFSDKQWFRGKSFDTFAPTGPYLVLRDQVTDPHRLKMKLTVNGETRQNSTTENMIFKIPQVVAFISRVMTLQPGDIIATGTPAGVGFYSKPERKLLRVGDVMEAEIESIGLLRNRVASEQ